MTLRRIAAALAVGLCTLVGIAPAAGADPARPGNYRSTVLRITPPTGLVTAKVVGGDGFLDLKVTPGHSVAIPGYTGEPWLRINTAGVVQENQASSARYLNETRYGSEANIQIPDWVTRENATKHPRWKTVGTGGRFIWHDHRIHYMNTSIPPTMLKGTNRVVISDRDDGLWYIPLTVDGHEHQIFGELVLFPAPSPLPMWAIAVVVLLALAAAGVMLKDPSSRVAGGVLVIVGGLATYAGASELAAVPSAAGGNPIWVALPIVTVVLGVGALAIRSAAGRAIAVLASAAALGVWAALRIPALGKAVPLGSLDPTLTRVIIALGLGTALGSAIAAIASGGLALRLADLDEDDDGDGDGDAATDPSHVSG